MYLVKFPWANDKSKSHYQTVTVNTLRPRQNGRHFPDDIFNYIFLNEKVLILMRISLKFVPKCSINNVPALVQLMAWRRPGDKPLSEPMMVRFPTHICVTRPQWVNGFWLTNVMDTICASGVKFIWQWSLFMWSLKLIQRSFDSPICFQTLVYLIHSKVMSAANKQIEFDRSFGNMQTVNSVAFSRYKFWQVVWQVFWKHASCLSFFPHL